jgi:hypothetical protein
MQSKNSWKIWNVIIIRLYERDKWIDNFCNRCGIYLISFYHLYYSLNIFEYEPMTVCRLTYGAIGQRSTITFYISSHVGIKNP